MTTQPTPTILARYVLISSWTSSIFGFPSITYLPIIILGLMLLTLGGSPFLLAGIFLRTVVGLHAELRNSPLWFTSLRHAR